MRGDKEVTYWKEGGFHIQRRHIHGWIDKETEEYHPNQYLAEFQELTEEHFPSMFYGGLEKDLIKPEKFQARTKKTRRPKKGELPPPINFYKVP